MYDGFLQSENIANSEFAQTTTVAVLAGGSSTERDISLASGKATQEALQEAGFRTQMIDPAQKDQMRLLFETPFDVAFLCLHGKNGEDGSIQGFLQTIGVPYTGSDVSASALAYDKSRAKSVYREAGILVPRSIEVNRQMVAEDEEALDRIAKEVAREFLPLCVVKPVCEGSSYGVSIVGTEEDVKEALKKAFDIAERVLIEQFVQGREYTVAVVGSNVAHALPVIEIVPKNEFYDFASKYEPGGSEHLCPAPLSEEKTEEVKKLAIKAHQALGCSGASRSDFILDSEGRFWILETNTIPGMTKTSLLPDAARAEGVEFPELCARLVKMALSSS